jgi:hypothetical protein
MNQRSRDTTVVFAGAGASTAVNRDHYPTTVEFFDQLPVEVKGDPFFEQFIDLLHEERGSDAVIDVELLLAKIEELQQFIHTVADAKAVPGWFLRGTRLAKVLNPNVNFQSILDAAEQAQPRLRMLVERINRQVYQLFRRMPAKRELERTWVPFLQRLFTTPGPIEIFTTNYDLVIEAALEDLRERDIGYPKIQTGRRNGVLQTLDTRVWIERRSDESRGGVLTKLHGSIDWSRSESDVDGAVYVGSDPHFKGSDGRHVIIYPGFKGLPDRQPFGLFHEYFQKTLLVASRIVFVGFAFRDTHINQLLSQYLPQECRIAVLNPDPDVVTPFEETRVRRIRRPFDHEGILEAANYLEHGSD